MRPTRLHLLALLTLALATAATAAGLDLPVWTPGSDVLGPCYRGDVLELRLTAAAARAVLPRGAGATRARAVGRLGLAGIDAVAAALGVSAFEPEFRAETPPERAGEIDFTAFQLVHLSPGSDLVAALDALRALPEVESAEAIAVLPASALPNDSLAFATYWLYRDQAVRTDMHAPEAWLTESGDTSIVVGILDTGVIPYHPDLGGRAGERGQMYVNWAERAGAPGVDDDGNGYIDDFGGWDFVAAIAGFGAIGEDARFEDNDPNDFAGHGTAVAGIIGALAGNGIGLAGVVPRVRLMPLRIGWLGSNQVPPSGIMDMSYAAAAIRYATRNGVSVINCSWESVFLSGLDAALTAAARAGMVVVNASGNFATSLTYLGQRPEVIAVAATDSLDAVWPYSVLDTWVDVSAAGAAITTTMLERTGLDSLATRKPSYKGSISGTSLAAPQVAGAVALLQAQRRAQGRDPFTPMGALLRVRETADDIRLANPTYSGYGTGRLNLLRALTDAPTSLAVRTHARSVGPGVVLSYNDGRVRTVYAFSDRTLIAYDGSTGDTVWVRAFPPASGAPTGNLATADFGPAVGVLLVMGTTTGTMFAVHDDGRPAAGWPVLAQAGVNLSSGAAIADVDGDGALDVISGGTATTGSRLWAWSAQGVPLSGFPFDPGTLGISLPCAADLDGQPGAEVAFVDGSGALRVVGAGGLELPGFPSAPFTSARAPIMARLGMSGTPPSVLVASAGAITAFASDGSMRWNSTVAGTPSQDPALADFDGDGVDEIVLLQGAPTAVVLLDSTGAAFTGRPGWPAALAAAPVGPLVVGALDAAHGPCVGFFQSTGFSALDDSAHVLASFPKPGLAGQSPTLADLDGDGATEIAAGTALADSNLYTFDAGPGTWSASLAQWCTPRGDFARTASHPAGGSSLLLIDRVRPAAIVDLAAQPLGTTSVRLEWTATGDDSLSGTATRVLLRRAVFPLDEQNFNTGLLVATPAPGAPGSADSVRITNLPEGSSWWFAMRVLDDAGNVSALANPVSASLPSLPPGAIADLRVLSVAESSVVVAWTAVGDDGSTGRPRAYLLAASTEPIVDDAAFAAAPVQLRRPAFRDAGAAETLSVLHLTPGRRWRFAVRAEDRVFAFGALSNVPEVITPVGGALAGRIGVALAARPMPATAQVTLDWQGDPDATAAQQLLVFDLSGRELRRIALGREPGGSYNWDGRDGESRLLPAGLYFLRLISGARHADSRVVFVR
jgi:hypothetical protein